MAGLDQFTTALEESVQAPEGTRRSGKHLSGRTCDCRGMLRKSVLCVVLVMVWMVMAIPTVVFYLPHSQESTETTSESVNSTCKETEVYSGEICRKPLQSCLLGNQSTGVLYIPATGKQEELELQAHQLLANLTAFQPNQDYCEDAIAQLLCLYLFCPCDWNGTLYMPSFQQCQSIRDGPCASEWTWVKVNVTLPDCESFSDSSTVGCYLTEEIVSGSGSGHEDRRNKISMVPTDTLGTEDLNITCSEDFFFNGTTCQPECNEWTQFPSSRLKIGAGFLIFFGAIALGISSIVVVISCIRHKKLLKFPANIMIFYQNIDTIPIVIVIMIGFVDRKALFCSSKDLIESFHNPTAFCTISGIVTIYCAAQFVFWWMCHCLLLFWMVVHPLHFKAFPTHRLKYVHGVLLGLGLTIPAVLVGVTFNGGEYTMPGFPPPLCLPSNEAASFYSLILTSSIMVVTGVSLLVLIFDKLLKVIRTRAMNQFIGQAKVLIVLCYYSILAVMVLTTYSLGLRNISQVHDEIWDYFECESKGNGEDCDGSGFALSDLFSTPVAPMLSVVLVGLTPTVNLLFAVPHKKLLSACRRRCARK